MNADDNFDLIFSPPTDAVNQGIEIDENEPSLATLKDATEAFVTVEATDTGAYGKLKAEVQGVGLVAECEKCTIRATFTVKEFFRFLSSN